MREAMTAHRANPSCASCHARMDPIGFAMENFDAVGRWRDHDGGSAIDASGTFPDGVTFDGMAGLQESPAHRPSAVRQHGGREAPDVRARAEPAVLRRARRAGDRAHGAASNDTLASLVVGVVKSAPFLMRARHREESAAVLAYGNEERADVHHANGSPTADVPARPRHDARAADARCHGAGALPPRRKRRRGSAFSTSPTASSRISGRRKPPGADYELTPILKPLEALKGDINVVSGLAHLQADTFGDGTGDHPRASAAWLTGVHAYDRTLPGIEVKLATSADQIIAQHIGKTTPVSSIELSVDYPDAGRVRFGRLLLRQHVVVAQRDDAEPDGDPPARRLRASVRRRRQRGRAARAHPQDRQHSRFGQRRK